MRYLSALLFLTATFSFACTTSTPSSDDDGEETSTSQQGSGGSTSTAAGGMGGSGGMVEACGSCDNPCDGEPCTPKPAPNVLPGEEWFGQFVIADYEYWPYNNGQPSYPDDIGWGYLAGTPQAKACMAEARENLVEILEDPPAELVLLNTTHDTQGTYAFYNWNNDYTDAAADGMAQETFRHLWIWEESFIKWISETNRDGRCILPTRQDLVTFADACLATYPNCHH